MNTWIDIINNNINLLNCIFKKYKLNSEFILKNENDLYYIENIDRIDNKTIYKSQKVWKNKLIVINYAIESIILENMDKLKDILEKHKKDYIDNNINLIDFLGF